MREEAEASHFSSAEFYSACRIPDKPITAVPESRAHGRGDLSRRNERRARWGLHKTFCRMNAIVNMYRSVTWVGWFAFVSSTKFLLHGDYIEDRLKTTLLPPAGAIHNVRFSFLHSCGSIEKYDSPGVSARAFLTQAWNYWEVVTIGKTNFPV